jgi:hypothetical protein
MGAHPHGLRCLAVLAAVLVILVPSAASANMLSFPFDGALRQRIIFGLICLFIVLVEGAVIKLVLLGTDAPSWPRAFLLAVVLNAATTIVAIRREVYFDWWEFRFYPDVFTVFGTSLVVEGVPLIVLFVRRLTRAIATAFVMNLASYAVLVMIQFPKGALEGYGWP